MKRILINGAFVIVIILSVFLYAKIFLSSGAVPQTQAQISNYNQNTNGEIKPPDGRDDGDADKAGTDWFYVFLPYPQIGSDIWGQRYFEIDIVPNNVAGDVYVKAFLSTGEECEVYIDRHGIFHPLYNGYLCKNGYSYEDLGELGCELEQRLDDQRWDGWCDTLELENSNDIYFQMHAYDMNNSEMVLCGGSDIDCDIMSADNNQLFGQFNIENNYSISGLGGDSTISGVFNWNVYLSGDASQALVDLQHGDGNLPSSSLQLTRDGGNHHESVWSYNFWNSSELVNGAYIVVLNFHTLFGVERSAVVQYGVEIFNEEEEALCTPNWDCGDWSDCSSAGVQTRECDDTACNMGSITETQTCLPSEDGTTPPATDPPDGNNATVDPEPLTVVMSYPQQGDIVSGEVILKASVDGEIQGLEFSYRPVQGGLEHLIGQASRSTTNEEVWQRSWNTDEASDGEYYVFARVEDLAGQNFLSNFVPITINHGQASLGEPAPEVEVPEEIIDSDNDGVSDNIEEQIGSDPYRPDSNNNDITDAEEIINDLNPASAEPLSDLVVEGRITHEEIKAIKESLHKIAFEQPTKSGILNPEELKVIKVDNISPVIGENYIVFSGVGPPNTYITLFIYSNPIVVTVKTDESGNFTYTLDKDLMDGQHEVYVTITDETGKIQEKSSPLSFFIRRTQAVTEEEYLRGDVNVEAERTTIVSNYLLIAVAIVGIVLIIILGAYLVSKKGKNE
jgi:hypothetical protein